MPGVDSGRPGGTDMPSKLARIETEALKLDAKSRAALAGKLLRSLETATDMANEKAWYDEAERRERELDEGKVTTIPARDVLRRLRSETGKSRRNG
jgi:hypothetical protein